MQRVSQSERSLSEVSKKKQPYRPWTWNPRYCSIKVKTHLPFNLVKFRSIKYISMVINN